MRRGKKFLPAAIAVLCLPALASAHVSRSVQALADAEVCDPPSNQCNLSFNTQTQDCSAAYPPVGTPPLTQGQAGFVNFGSPQVSPVLRLKARGSNPYKKHVFVLNTLNNEVVVLDRDSLSKIASVQVGLDPSSLAQSRDGKTVLVSNWTSDNVSVIDTATLRVVATIDPRGGAGEPLLPEPMGIAVYKNETAYVAVSGSNRIAVVDLASRSITQMIDVPAVDPRSISLRRKGDYLAVAGFASLNRTEGTFDPFLPNFTGLTDPGVPLNDSCGPIISTKPFLFDAADPGFMDSTDPDFRDAFNCYVGGRINTLTSPIKLDPIAVNARIPDHDVVIIDTETKQVVFSTDTLASDPGTLNYGVSWDKRGRRLALATTHARNDAGDQFGDRPWLNRVVRFDFDKLTGALSHLDTVDIDVDAGNAAPIPASRAATPYGITPYRSKGWLVTAAGSDRLVSLDRDGVVEARVEVGLTPRGVVRDRGRRVYVFNASAFNVQKWDLKDGTLLAQGSIGDNPLPMEERHGFHLFNGDQFSINRTFSCASCHPDGDTDHLVWRLNCLDGIRLTMTLRQVKDTLPFHWPGDKCNGQKIMEDGVMGLFGQPVVPSSCDTDLTWQFIESFRQPPPGERPADDSLSPDARLGLVIVQRAKFKTVGDFPELCNGQQPDPVAWPRIQAASGDPGGTIMNFNTSRMSFNGAPTTFVAGLDGETCSNVGCHAGPAWGNGTFGGIVEQGFCGTQPFPTEAITFLGAHDRQKTEDDGRSAMYDFLVALSRYRSDVGAEGGAVLDGWGVPKPGSGLKGFLGTFFRHPELEYQIPGAQGFATVDNVERFVREAATGPSASVGRQVVAVENDTGKTEILSLVSAADQGKVALLATGVAAGTAIDLVWNSSAQVFKGTGVPGGQSTLDELLDSLSGGDAAQFTAAFPIKNGTPFGIARDSQPYLFGVTRDDHPVACSENPSGRLADFSLSGDAGSVDVTVWGTNIEADAMVFVNGQRTGSALTPVSSLSWSWTLPSVPGNEDTLVLQIQNPDGLLSNEFAALVIP